MENNIYLKIFQKDGRIENFHFCLTNHDPVLDVMNTIKASGGRFEIITADQFVSEISNSKPSDLNMLKIAIHADLVESGDADGEKIGFMEHYEIDKK